MPTAHIASNKIIATLYSDMILKINSLREYNLKPSV